MANIHKNMNNASILCKNLPSSICLDSRNKEFMGSLFEFVLNKVNIGIIVNINKIKDRVKDIIEIFLKLLISFNKGFIK